MKNVLTALTLLVAVSFGANSYGACSACAPVQPTPAACAPVQGCVSEAGTRPHRIRKAVVKVVKAPFAAVKRLFGR